MQICVSFPKDKEEMEKQRMAAMFKKLGGGSSTGVMQDGEQRMKEINNDLTKFMKDNKEERKPSPSMTTRTKLEKDDGYTVQTVQGQQVLPLNKLVDMYAFGNPNVFGRNNDSLRSLSQGSEG